MSQAKSDHTPSSMSRRGALLLGTAALATATTGVALASAAVADPVLVALAAFKAAGDVHNAAIDRVNDIEENRPEIDLPGKSGYYGNDGTWYEWPNLARKAEDVDEWYDRRLKLAKDARAVRRLERRRESLHRDLAQQEMEWRMRNPGREYEDMHAEAEALSASACRAEREALADLLETEPTTMAGAIAVLEHIGHMAKKDYCLDDRECLIFFPAIARGLSRIAAGAA